jgi:serine phosphatase RsbU (regulator of sigma subunit)
MASSSRRYTEDDVALARVVAGRIASSLDNQRLNDRQRLIAQTLQRSLLPASLPVIPGIDVAVRYWPAGEATEVGGDFYDIFSIGEPGQWAVVIGDVCGTGPAAAALTGLARHSIRDSAWHGDGPVEVLTSLHRAVERSEGGSFLTAVYATLDTAGQCPQLTVTCAGHPLPVRIKAATTTRLGMPGTLVGAVEPLAFHPVTVALEDGDVVVFSTDGATDLRPPHNLEPEQFTELIERACRAGGCAETIADRIHGALTAVLPFDRRNDDIALLVLRVGHPSATSVSPSPI